MLTKKEEELLNALEGAAQEHDIEIVTVEIVGAKKSPIIRVYIDAKQGVGFDELSSAQMWVNEIVDNLDPFPGAYQLEVSSPGIDRPLRTLTHFQNNKGEEVVLTTIEPLDGRSKFTGIIHDVVGDVIQIEVDAVIKKIALSDIKRARLKGTVKFS